MQCWQDLAQFQQFLLAMLSQMGPIPFTGVTDGSDAKAGQIGEYIIANGNLSYPASVTTHGSISPLVLPPGDWNVGASLQTSTDTATGAFFYLDPQPTGFSTTMIGWYGAATVSTEFAVVQGIPARASLTVPTLLPFAVGIGAGPNAGVATLTVQARRAR
jgi:hypothetical protein